MTRNPQLCRGKQPTDLSFLQAILGRTYQAEKQRKTYIHIFQSKYIKGEIQTKLEQNI